MNEDKLHRDVDRGERAKALIENDLLQEAFARLEADYIAAWRSSPARDTDARERLWQAVNVLGLVRAHIAVMVSSGKLAQRELDDLAKSAPKQAP
jgi:hypothetical protein